jgi:hypothetical protein
MNGVGARGGHRLEGHGGRRAHLARDEHPGERGDQDRQHHEDDHRHG